MGWCYVAIFIRPHQRGHCQTVKISKNVGPDCAWAGENRCKAVARRLIWFQHCSESWNTLLFWRVPRRNARKPVRGELRA
jgi:hypothetical protein